MMNFILGISGTIFLVIGVIAAFGVAVGYRGTWQEQEPYKPGGRVCALLCFICITLGTALWHYA